MIAIVAAVAKRERIRISERVRTGLDHGTQQRQAAGASPGVRFPLADRIPAPGREILARDRTELNTNTATARRAYAAEALRD